MYEENIKPRLTKDQIILLDTDGIWEARNRNGDMFGKAPIYDLIRKNSALSASQILNNILGELDTFRKGVKNEDDITLVVIKSQGE
jgi:sigma-B regulation protein RsbU (phosphoserine phosphatase)